MALRQDGQYWYGDNPTDVWEYFVWLTREFPEPVNHWRQAICACGNGTFSVWGDEEIGHHQRQCTACDAQLVMFANEFTPPQKWRDDLPLLECICFGEEFEVVGVTMPFGGSSVESARTFYLGLRCTACGCLGCYAEWNPRYNDHAAYLAML